MNARASPERGGVAEGDGGVAFPSGEGGAKRRMRLPSLKGEVSAQRTEGLPSPLGKGDRRRRWMRSTPLCALRSPLLPSPLGKGDRRRRWMRSSALCALRSALFHFPRRVRHRAEYPRDKQRPVRDKNKHTRDSRANLLNNQPIPSQNHSSRRLYTSRRPS